MKLTQIDLNLFVVFDTIYAERNLTRAADRLSITQPAVSNALARLRTNFKDPLFIRTSSGMQPTAFAESIADRVAEALQSLQIAAQPAVFFNPAASDRRFQISMLDFNEATFLPLIGRALQKEAPSTTLHSFRVPRAELRPSLERGHVDLAIDIPLNDNADLISHTLRSEKFVCAVRKGHPVLHDEFTLDSYLALGHVHVSGRPRGRGAVDIALRRMRLKRNIIFQLQSYLAVNRLVQNSDLAVTVTAGWARALNLEVLQLPIDLAPMEIKLHRHVRSNGDAAIVWLFDLIKDLPVTLHD
ncbi:Nodulation protein D 2 [Thalassovita gelatinovora]|uniref:Nodulation protein D 2 n=1 Tax=Thalassovita gelatinovora TaxID=53501 RepID=A0A0P1FCB3_THAGE|nr:LysR family transcriptional regulator [Thalassovita gelatinovora]QIZ80444.1 LysR family transcriptional regulator [Thalassovita gelatinovora]CUH65849.1 Nodulation protein D 2 [Thalassovita gelatinovora]SEQ72651.1 transcriptional regulator, LysR family [Thalassovita gelatinovora]